MAKLPSVRRDRQVVRILGILKTLSEGGHPSVHQLAERFKTRRESIYRDLQAIRDAGYPIVGDEQGRLSRPRLLRDRQPAVPPLAFTGREVAALTWAAKQAGSRQPFSRALATALPKLQALVPSRDARLSTQLEGSLIGGDHGTKDYSAHEPTILQLVEAIVSHRRCLVRYQAPWRAAPSNFRFDPYRLRWVQGGLYCVGLAPTFTDLITLAVERITSLEMTDESFTVDPSFDPKRFESEAFGVTLEKPMTVVIRFTADQAPYIREREWHPTQQFRTLKDGRLEMTFRAGGTFEITRWILGWSEAAEVVRPVSLRREVAFALKAASHQYRVS